MVFGASGARAALVYGVSLSNTLFSFDSSDPTTLLSGAAISGLASNESVRAIDFRPANGQLYALGSFGHIYTLNLTTGAASLVSTLAADPSDSTSPFVALSGTDFGIDFDPVADRLRVVSNARQNLRVNITNGLTITDSDLNPNNPNVAAAAYTSAGQLFTIDSESDMLNIQNPANNGMQSPVGSLGIDVGALGGLDILSSPAGNAAFAALTPVGSSITNFYTVNLGTGAATLVGQIDGGFLVTDIAVIPEPATLGLLGLGVLGLLRRRLR
jgi:hypothetical protein